MHLGVALLIQLSEWAEKEIFMRHLNGTVHMGGGGELFIQLNEGVEMEIFMRHLKGTVIIGDRYHSYNNVSG